MLEFDQENHIYRLNGEIVPGVTSILSDVGLVDFSGVSQSLLSAKAEFGSMAHLYTAYRDEGVLDESSVPDDMQIILDLWEEFKSEYDVKMIQIEQPVASRIWKFACTPDRLAIVAGELSVIEFKTTSKIDKAVKWQLAGQQICLQENGHDVKQRWCVRISNGEKQIMKYPESELRRDKAVITSAVTIYHAKRSK